MSDSPGISGLAVGLATVGGVLVWSAIRNVSPIDTIRDVLGKPSAGRPISTPFSSTTSGVQAISGAAFGRAAAEGALAGGAILSGPAAKLVAECRKLIGVPYVWASASPTGVDCSGLLVLAAKRAGFPNVPRFTTYSFGSWAKSQGATRVGPSEFRSGDVILRAGHMGIAVSADRLIHAPQPGSKVQEAAIWDRGNWWGWRFK